MAPVHSTPRHLPPLLALACMLVPTACPGPKAPDLGDATDAASDSETTGTTAPGETANEVPTTGPATDGTDGAVPTTGSEDTMGHVFPDSTTSTTTASTGGGPDDCPYEPAGVDATLVRVEHDVPADLSARPCASEHLFAGLQVISAVDGDLVASVCTDATCGACDPADTLTLSLTLPDGFAGVPGHLAADECVQLDLEWSRPGEDPDSCALSGIALTGLHDGTPGPVPTFLYRYTESLPHTDVHGPFALTGQLHGPGAITCPCDGDCCDEQPGSRRLRFTASLFGGEIGAPPVEPGATVPLFAFGDPEGGDLFGDISLVRAHVSADCSAPARHEWLLRVTPG